MNEAKRLKLLGISANILANGTTRQNELFEFYVELGIKAVREMMLKEEAQIAETAKKKKKPIIKKGVPQTDDDKKVA